MFYYASNQTKIENQVTFFIFQYILSSIDVATSALLNKMVLEVDYRGRSFEVNQSVIDASATFRFFI